MSSEPSLPALVAVSEHGRCLAARVRGEIVEGSARDGVERAWHEGRPIVFFGALGIAVRLVAPLLNDKRSDPAVVVVDDAARHAISLVSGHEGGANELAAEVARQIGAEPVITTASELLQPDLVLGIGCSRGATEVEIEELAREGLRCLGASFESVAEVASIDLKQAEAGLREFAERWHFPLRFFSSGELAQVSVPNGSAAVAAAVGSGSVAEAAALLAANERDLQVPKLKSARVTVAIARRSRQGELSIVGLGPGGWEQLTLEAVEALRSADLIVGYDGYVRMVQGWLPLAVCEGSPIGQEVERVERALELAGAGRRAALVCSGDAGVYGLAGLAYERADDRFPVRVIPGVTAATSAAALLGAPLMADFAAISLSDLQTSTDVVRRRLRAAAEGDMVTVLYNPASSRRRQLLAEAQQIFLGFRHPATPVGMVRNAYRPDQSVRVVQLGSMPLDEIDMFTTLVLGNSQTVVRAGVMVTPRASGEGETSGRERSGRDSR